MLRALFDALEKDFGPSLDGLATFVWTAGLVVVAFQVLAPFARVALALSLSRAGLEQVWVLTCGACQSRSPVGTCLKCGAPLPVPAMLKLFVRTPSGPRAQRIGWVLSLFGGLAFLAGSFAVLSLAPQGSLERLFAGAALLSWAALGFFLGRAVGPRGGGPIARARELACAAGAAALLGTSFFLEQTVHPVPERVLGRVKAGADSVELDAGPKLAISGAQLGLELQLVDAPGLGLARVLPLAWVGATRSEIELGTADAWLRDSTWKHASTLLTTGVTVKRRTETFPLAAGQSYEMVLREREVLLRPAK